MGHTHNIIKHKFNDAIATKYVMQCQISSRHLFLIINFIDRLLSGNICTHNSCRVQIGQRGCNERVQSLWSVDAINGNIFQYDLSVTVTAQEIYSYCRYQCDYCSTEPCDKANATRRERGGLNWISMRRCINRTGAQTELASVPNQFDNWTLPGRCNWNTTRR